MTRILVVDPFLGEFGLGSAFPDADSIPRSQKPTIAGRYLVLDAVAAAQQMGGPWDVAVSRDAAGAPVAIGLVEMGLASRAVCLDPGMGGLAGDAALVQRIAAEAPPREPRAPLPEPGPGGEFVIDSPEMIAVLADDDGTDPVRAEYGRRLRAAIAARLPLDPELEADGSDARWMYWWEGYVGAAERIRLAVTAREGFVGKFLEHHNAEVAHLDVDDVEWLRDPEGFRAMVLELAR